MTCKRKKGSENQLRSYNYSSITALVCVIALQNVTDRAMKTQFIIKKKIIGRDCNNSSKRFCAVATGRANGHASDLSGVEIKKCLLEVSESQLFLRISRLRLALKVNFDESLKEDSKNSSNSFLFIHSKRVHKNKRYKLCF